jgi:hypothetical protein
MHISIKHTFLITLLTLILLAGCAQLRELTYPQDFVYLEKEEVESLMQNMERGLRRLNLLVAEASQDDTELQKNIVAELDSIEHIALRLSGGHKQTNQIVIGDHIEQFIADVSMAKTYAKISPPNYTKAKKIKNGCRACHQYR